MTGDNARENALEEQARGEEALAAARHLLDGGFHADAVSRAYYAAFHWAQALLVSHGIQARSHRGVIQLIGLHFVREGRLAESDAAGLAHLETYRELSDYSASASFTRAQAEEEIARADQFIEACKRVIGAPAQ